MYAHVHARVRKRLRIKEMEKQEREIFWFALTVFKDIVGLEELFAQKGWETYRAFVVTEQYTPGGLVHKEVPLIPRLLFVKCPVKELIAFKLANNERFMWYRAPESTLPGPVKDDQMEAFRFVTSVNDGNLRVLGKDRPEYHQGDRVRVIQGIYKGAEGYIKRIRRSRELLVCVQGVTVVAISKLPPEYLEKI